MRVLAKRALNIKNTRLQFVSEWIENNKGIPVRKELSEEKLLEVKSNLLCEVYYLEGFKDLYNLSEEIIKSLNLIINENLHLLYELGKLLKNEKKGVKDERVDTD